MQPDRKAILADPLSLLPQVRPGASADEIARLRQLWEQLGSANARHKLLREQSGVLSRHIGAARKHQQPVDTLLAEMQRLSAQARQLSAEIRDTEDAILARFAGAETGATAVTENPPAQARLYPATTAPGPGEVSIGFNDASPAEWNAYIGRNPVASVYHRAEWRELISTVFGHNGYYFCARNSQQEIVGVLPLIHMNSRLFGNFMVSLPYFNYGGPVADHPLIEQQLVDAANSQAAALGAAHVEYRDDIPRDAMPARTGKVSMLLPLPASSETLLAGFSTKLRSQIRRAQRENPGTHFGGAELLDEFYAVFSRNMRDLGTPVYSKRFFLEILQRFPDQCTVVVVRLAGKPVAAGFLIGHRDVLEIPWASSLREVNHLAMNINLYWEILSFAIKRDYRLFDFGRSSRDAGTFRFKQQWGAQPHQLYWHYWLANQSPLPAINPANPKYALMIRLWKRLPVAVSRVLGPPIVRNIP